jgi:geranylgeranyl diphosphate synthase type II
MAVASSAADFEERLHDYGRLAREAMLRFLPDREPRRYLYDLIADYPRRGGRGMRPALHIASARAHGASVEQAIDTAASLELLHNALLVIDDIQDGSRERRGRPTLHRAHGLPIALNAGSAMSVLSLVPLLGNVERSGPHVAYWIFQRAIRVAQASAEGQAMELGWRLENRLDVTPAEYLDMILKKTCAYSTIYPVEAGAVVGRQVRHPRSAVTRFGFFLGAAFQVQDDLLNLTGAPEQYGKELLGDLEEGKRTLVTIHLVSRLAPRDRERFARIMGRARSEKSPEDVAWVSEQIRARGSIGFVRKQLMGLVGAAGHEFERAFGDLPSSPDKELLRRFPRWVVEQGR